MCSAKYIHKLDLAVRVGVVRNPIESRSRLGACEVTVRYMCPVGVEHSQLIHSKIGSTCWPSNEIIENSLYAFLRRVKVPHQNFDEKYLDETCRVCPIGIVDWNETVLGKDPSWRGSENMIDWVYDSRQRIPAEKLFGVCKLYCG